MRHKTYLIAFTFLIFSETSFSNTIYLDNRMECSAKYSEKEKIYLLIESIENLKNAKFLRNGSSYEAQKAADHLRLKLNKAGSSIKTAMNFIDKLASESSYSGQPYYIVYSNGIKITSRDFLIQKLNEINV